MKCTCNEISLCDEHYNEYLKKYKEFIKTCIAESLNEYYKSLGIKIEESKFVIKVSSCEMAIRHNGTMELLITILHMKERGCDDREIKKAVIDRLGSLGEFKDLVKDITK